MKPVFCVIEHLHRDRAVAEDAAAGRFTCAGETLELGTEPDWLGADLPADEEWRIDWVKFYYGLDLAHAYRTTGEPRFRDAWERLVRSYLRQVPPDRDPSEVTARRIVNWIYAWQGFGALPNGLEPALADRIAAEARHVRETLTPERNHRTLELYALAIVALAFDDAELLRLAIGELDRNLAEDFLPDGVHRECSTHYHMIALRSFAGLRENARRFGVALARRLRRAPGRAAEFARHCCRPDGTIPALSDADTGDYTHLLELLGVEPGETDASFPHGGYFTQRSDERFLIFDCGPLGDGGHGHYDLLSFEASAGRAAAGRRPRALHVRRGQPNLRHWFKGTAAHNTVCVDGLDQTPYARKAPRGPTAEPRFLGRTKHELVGEARSPVYEAVHRRRIAFVDDRHWVIEDTLTGEREHRYDLRFHLPPGEAWTSGSAVLAPGAGAGDRRRRRDRDRARLGLAALRRQARRARGQRRRPRPRRDVPDGAAAAMMLAPDPAVPHRDELLDGRRVAELLSGRLLDGEPVEDCRRKFAKYRVGEGLRVVYRIAAGGRDHHVAARGFAPGASAVAYHRALSAAVPAPPLRPVVHVPELDAVFWTFPNDRRLTTLPLLAGRSGTLDRLVGRPSVTPRLVAYSAERSASAECAGEDGRVLAYAKVHTGDVAERERRRLEDARAAESDCLHVPRVLGTSALDGALAVEAVEGRSLESLDEAELPGALRRLGARWPRCTSGRRCRPTASSGSTSSAWRRRSA